MSLSEMVEPTRAQAEQMAIDFIGRNGSDCVGIIDTEEKLAAAWLYQDLHKRGFLIATIGETGPVYRLTRKGHRALLPSKGEGE